MHRPVTPQPVPPHSLHQIDLLKLLAAQFIVWHHLCAYGPLSDAAGQAWPEAAAFLYDYGRMAVQVFLVVGGYLAARGLQQVPAWSRGVFARALAKRYRRLALPFAAALLLAVGVSSLARGPELGDLVPGAPSAAQLLSHLLLMPGLLGHEALSLGVWYVAMDFQLFLLLLALYALPACLTAKPARALRITQWLTVALLAASLWGFNRDAGWDDWAPYFFGAYGLGACAFWARSSRARLEWVALLGLLVGLALLVDFRERIALAGLVACSLVLARGLPAWLDRPALLRANHAGALRSYALFLVHFPVLLLANLAYASAPAEAFEGAPLAAGLMLCAWLAAWVLADAFHRWVERGATAGAGRAARPAPVAGLRPPARALDAVSPRPRA